jgi:cysteinyl-tRNA synthetase
MALRIFNSLSGKKEDFKPGSPDVVKLYNCGPTVYNFNHIGNFRSYMAVDMLRRSLLFLGYKVEHTTNITDVEDKIIANAIREKKNIDEFTAPFIQYFLDDLKYLGIQDVEHRPRATKSIPAMIELMQNLEKGGHTYAQDGDVYFRLRSFADYGRLSHIEPDQLKAAAGGRFTADEYTKEDIRDFALWKKQESPEEPSWQSPWGAGRPGWHLECSAMIREIYGPGGVDIHAGGIDLLFPHHENEIAQSCCGYPGENFVRYWVHNEHLLVDGKKMSKSAGNYFTLRDFSEREKLEAIVQKGAPADLLKIHERGAMARALRYLLLSTHYRSRLNFTFDNLKASDAACERMQHCVDRLLSQASADLAWIEKAALARDAKSPEALFQTQALSEHMREFREALEDDVNSARALAAVFESVTFLNQTSDEAALREGLVFLYLANQVLGILDFSDLSSRKKPQAEADAWIEDKIQERLAARAAKNWALSDQIRDELKARGIILKDSRDSTTWERA